MALYDRMRCDAASKGALGEGAERVPCLEALELRLSLEGDVRAPVGCAQQRSK